MDEQRTRSPGPSRAAAASRAPGPAPREALDALLREVDGLRLLMGSDLCVAASAAEAGVVELAHDVVSGDCGELAGFEARALGHLSRLQEPGLSAPPYP